MSPLDPGEADQRRFHLQVVFGIISNPMSGERKETRPVTGRPGVSSKRDPPDCVLHGIDLMDETK